MEWLKSLLESQQILTLFLVIGLGYAVGEVAIAGFRLGVGAVLFVGLLLGMFVPKAAPPALLSTVGLVLFFYGIGIQYGKSFVEGLTGATARRQITIGVISLLVSGAGAIALIQHFKISADVGAGLFAGALVNTAALESVLTKAGNDLPTVGYGVAYPFGIFGPILCIYLAMRILRPKIDPPTRRGIRVAELDMSNPAIVGKPLAEIMLQLPSQVQVVAVRQNGHNYLPRGTLRVGMGDELMIEGEEIYVQQSRQIIGEETPIDMFLDRHDLDQVEMYVSKPSVIGRNLGELRLTERLNSVVLSISRGNAELYPQPGLVLEAGDRIRVATEAGNAERLQDFFGDSCSSTAEVSYLALGLGMVLGVLFGLIPFPLPGFGTFSFGAAGGAMIVALGLGWLGRTRHLTWTMPPAANLTLRNFGLTLFLAVAGLRSAEKFLATVKETGFLLLGVGLMITLIAVLCSMILARTLFSMEFDEMLALVAGVTGNPAILAYASQAVPTNKPELGYAIVFPITTIIKIIVVQIILGVGATGNSP